ncbi:MAG: hypothetical protein V1797_03320 [Pseudomonadota bacterium]
MAFVDIAGFKSIMKDKNEARRVLNGFYNEGYDCLDSNDNTPSVDGLFVSDCGVLFVRHKHPGLIRLCDLNLLLDKICKLNRNMLNKDIMLTTSISYGDFNYEERNEHRSIGKSMLYGDAYLDAYLDNEKGSPKLIPTQCRIVINEYDNIMPNIDSAISQDSRLRHPEISKLHKSNGRKIYYMYYWMLNDLNEMQSYQNQLNLTKDAQYREILALTKSKFSPSNSN